MNKNNYLKETVIFGEHKALSLYDHAFAQELKKNLNKVKPYSAYIQLSFDLDTPNDNYQQNLKML